MSRDYKYSEAGVDREARKKSKKALSTLKQTYRFSRYGKVVRLPFGNIFPVGDRYLDFVIEGIGTKVLLAQLADKYDTIGIDGVAMAVNDVIRSGATPLAIVDNIHAQISRLRLVKEWMKGIVKGVTEAGCIVPGGEIGDVSDVIKGTRANKGFDMVFASVGEIFEKNIIYGNNIKPGDVVIGLRSSGIHSNGISLARKVLFKEWGGKYEPHDIPEGFSKEIVYEVLEPTRIYAKPLLNASNRVKIKGAVHITGDAYLKFDKLMKFSEGIGFEFDNFKPHPVFELIQKTASEVRGPIRDEEMFRTFNMGWGFAVVVEKTDQDSAIDGLEANEFGAERIGRVNGSGKIIVLYKGNRFGLQ